MRVLACLLALSAPLAAAEPEITNLAPPALDWTTTPEGVAFAPIEGDRFAGAYMAMVRLPAGLVSPAHVKSGVSPTHLLSETRMVQEMKP